MSKFFRLLVVLIYGTFIIGAFVYLYALVGAYAPKKVLKSLKEEYRGEKFEIIDSYGVEKENDRGLYIISPIKNKNIQFKMYNSTKYKNEDDYSSQRMKYYCEHCEDKSLLEDFSIEEYMVNSNNVEFLHYSLIMQINDYNEIPNKVKKIYDLVNYFISKDDKMFEAIFLQNKYIDYYFFINCDTQKTLEQEIYRAKYDYISKLKKQNQIEKLNEIGKEEIDSIWKPEKLVLVVNGKEITLGNDIVASVQYDSNNNEYYLSYPNEVFKKIDSIEILTIDMGNIKKIRYKNKVYKVKEEPKSKRKDNEIYLYDTIEQIFNKFSEKIEFDYENEKVYITLMN